MTAQESDAAFEQWWKEHGQFCRAGGGDYEKTFAYRAWQARGAQPVVPEGWKLVPVEPTYEMIDAAWRHGIDDEAPDPYYAYKAMLAAAPQPPEADSNSPESEGIKPEAVPVQMTEPAAWMLGCQTMGGDVGWKLSWSKSGAGVCHRLNGEEFEQPLYTEHQVRQLLASHGVK